MNVKLLTSIIDFLPDATFAIDKTGKVIAWNRAIEAMTGTKKEDVLDKADYIYAIPFYDIRRPMLIDLVLKENSEIEYLYDCVKRYGTAICAETFVPKLNVGKGAFIWSTAAALFDDKGNYQGAIESIRDITEIKETGNALRESEEKYHTIFNAVNDAIVIYDMEKSTIMDVNSRMCEMYGYSREEIIKSSLSKLSVFMAAHSEQNILSKLCLAATKSPQLFEWQAKDKNGRQFWTEINIRRILIGGHNYLLLASKDIGEHKHIEKQLEDERKRFLTLIEEAPFGIVLFDTKGKYLYINAKFKEIFGYDLQDIPNGKTWFKKAYPDSEYRHNIIDIWLNDVEKFRQNPSAKEGKQWTFTVTCKNNEQKIISFIVVRLPTMEYLMTLEDITEQKKAEEELYKRKAELDIKSTHLEEINAALKVLLRERENDKIELEEKFLSNIKELVIPYIEKLKRCRLDPNHMTYVDIIETNLNDIISPFLQKMRLKYAHLTPTEIEVANLIKLGKRTKEISEILHISIGAINFHRNNIRKKLSLNKEKVNLRSYLLSIK